jgi:protein-S-isoprenylcysteine O-methyltransferase Ste14
LLNWVLLMPFISLLVIPIAWLESGLLQKASWTGWAAFLTLVNALLLYIPWAIAIIPTRHLMIGPVTILGFFMIAVGLLLLTTALLPVLRVPGQIRSLPERLVVEGPYQWVRHPIYLSHFLLIGGAALACGALRVFLETPIVLGMAAVGGKYEETKRLLPLFGRTFEQYKDRTHFLLPAWGWVALGLIYSLMAFRVFFP